MAGKDSQSKPTAGSGELLGKQAGAGRTGSPGRSKGVKPSTLRTLTALVMVAFVCIGLAMHTGTGTPSMFGISSVAALCPLGAIEAAIASRTIIPAGFIGLAFVVVAVLLVGRAFCSWGCPMTLLRKLFGIKSPHERRASRARKKAKDAAGEQVADMPGAAAGSAASVAAAASGPAAGASAPGKLAALVGAGKPDDAPDPERGGAGDSRMWVLGGAVVTTAAFGFPVFCLICPVGLTFATIICLWRAIQFGEATWSLVVFPAILIIEVVVLRRWCHTLCPLGALIGLIARGNKTLRATLDAEACLESHGKTCGKCVEVCPEGIDLHEGALTTRPSECLKCGECRFACPMQAISFPFLPKKAAGITGGTDNGARNGSAIGAANDNDCDMTTSKGEAHD